MLVLAVQWWRQVAGAGAGVPVLVLCCELAVHVVETGCCWCRVPVLVPGAGAGAGAVSWLSARLRRAALVGCW